MALSRFLSTGVVIAAILYGLSLNGPLTISIVIPEGVNVNVVQPLSASNPQLLQQQPPPQQAPESFGNVLPPAPPDAAPPSPPPTFRKINESQRSVLSSILSYDRYSDHFNRILDRRYRRYSRIPDTQKEMISSALLEYPTTATATAPERIPTDYTAHFTLARAAIVHNSELTRKIAQHGREAYNIPDGEEGYYLLDEYYGKYDIKEDVPLVDEALAHVVRDWTEQGRKERWEIYPPILKNLNAYFKDRKEGETKQVLVPGFGLGRLAHEIAEIPGLEVTANDLDHSGIFAYNFILNQTSRANQHTFYPFATDWAQQLDAASRHQALMFPDYIPSPQSRQNVKVVEGDFLKAFTGAEEVGKYDVVVTLFFIDVGENVVDFVEMIHRLLKPGGRWINLGPLKFGAHAQVQLSAEEILRLSEYIGFEVDYDKRQSIETLYAPSPASLLKYTYVAQFWTATKKHNA